MEMIKLEFVKFRLQRQIIGVALTIIGLLLFLTISFVDNKVHTNQVLDTSQSVQRMIAFLAASMFMVYAAGLISKLISQY